MRAIFAIVSLAALIGCFFAPHPNTPPVAAATLISAVAFALLTVQWRADEESYRMRVLRLLADAGPLTASEIQSRAGGKRATVAVALWELRARELVASNVDGSLWIATSKAAGHLLDEQ